MTQEERKILRDAFVYQRGLLSPAILVNSIAGRNRQAVEALVSYGYLVEVPRDVAGKTVYFYRVTNEGRRAVGHWYKKVIF